MNDRRDRASVLVKQALDTVEAELGAPAPGRCPKKLGTCRETLKAYLAALETGALPPRRERDEGLGRLVADAAWPFGDPVADAILRAERAWRTC